MPLWNTTEAKFALQKQLVPDAKIVFDVGAKYGKYARRYLALFPAAQVYSFEPLPQSYSVLNNLAAKEDRLYSVPLAVLDTASEADFYILDRVGASSTLPPSSQWEEPTIRVTTKVQTTTLDTFCIANTISSIDLLNIDTNGTDLQVLLGAKELLTAGKVTLICVELIFWPYFEDQNKHDEIIKLLAEYDMHMIAVFPNYWQGMLRYADAIFIREGMKDV